MQEFIKSPLNPGQEGGTLYSRAPEAPSSQADTHPHPDIEALRGSVRGEYPTNPADGAVEPLRVSGDVVVAGSSDAAGIVLPFGRIAPTHEEIALATERALDNPVDYAVKRAA